MRLALRLRRQHPAASSALTLTLALLGGGRHSVSTFSPASPPPLPSFFLPRSGAFSTASKRSEPGARTMIRRDPGHEGEIDTEEREDPTRAVPPPPEAEDGADDAAADAADADAAPRWCPERQIYVGGVVPANAEDLDRLLSENGGRLRIFGYGSLCWNPGGPGATLSKFGEGGVTRTLGRARGWRRCWAQRSADHRGTPAFPGLVCTLLTDGEVRAIREAMMSSAGRGGPEDGGGGPPAAAAASSPSMTEGLIYTVPPHLVDDCLSELDFREKGGYERDVIDVVEDESGDTVQALLYRGTPDNPAFWTRALLDPPFAAAVMARAAGPSGPNDRYLYNLDRFLRDAAEASPAAAEAFEDHTGDADTMELAAMARALNDGAALHFLFGAGSDQHGQLRLTSASNAAGLVNGDEARDIKEVVLAVPKAGIDQGALEPEAVYAGGGHSALRTRDGQMYIWGWNDHGQLGRDDEDGGGGGGVDDDEKGDDLPLPVVPPLGPRVAAASLGHSHTAIVEAGTGRLRAFGDNGRGQVDGVPGSAAVANLAVAEALRNESFVDVSAGVFHTAAVTSDGALVAFGDDRYGQCGGGGNGGNGGGGDSAGRKGGETSSSSSAAAAVRRWRPDDGSKIVGVACGRRHTAALDEHGRVWTCGEDGYGQLGRGGAGDAGNDEGEYGAGKSGASKREKGARGSGPPRLVSGALGRKGSGCYRIDSGWSHCVAAVREGDGDGGGGGGVRLYGWGRNDRGQLGTGGRERSVREPRQLLPRRGALGGNEPRSVRCGAESTLVVDERDAVWGAGWNEHGNLGIGDLAPSKSVEDVCDFTRAVGERITRPPLPGDVEEENGGRDRTVVAAGGAHFLAIKVVPKRP